MLLWTPITSRNHKLHEGGNFSQWGMGHPWYQHSWAKKTNKYTTKQMDSTEEKVHKLENTILSRVSILTPGMGSSRSRTQNRGLGL